MRNEITNIFKDRTFHAGPNGLGLSEPTVSFSIRDKGPDNRRPISSQSLLTVENARALADALNAAADAATPPPSKADRIRFQTIPLPGLSRSALACRLDAIARILDEDGDL